MRSNSTVLLAIAWMLIALEVFCTGSWLFGVGLLHKVQIGEVGFHSSALLGLIIEILWVNLPSIIAVCLSLYVWRVQGHEAGMVPTWCCLVLICSNVAFLIWFPSLRGVL